MMNKEEQAEVFGKIMKEKVAEQRLERRRSKNATYERPSDLVAWREKRRKEAIDSMIHSLTMVFSVRASDPNARATFRLKRKSYCRRLRTPTELAYDQTDESSRFEGD